MAADILLVGNVTPRMEEQLAESFSPIRLDQIDDPTAYFKDFGHHIKGIAAYSASGLSIKLLDAMPNLKIISCFGVGYDAVDIPYALKRNIIVTHTPNVLNKDVANSAIMLLLASSRHLVHDHNWVVSGKWVNEGNAPLARSIEGAKVGILGLGRIGEEIARKLAVFNCKISYHTRTPKTDLPYEYCDTAKALAEGCDYMIAILPGGAATKHIVDETVLNALGPEGTFINIARGSIVDEEALVDALKDGRLGYAALDVFENEPHVPEVLFDMSNVILLPHIGSATVETRIAMGDLTVQNLRDFFEKGQPATPVPECKN